LKLQIRNKQDALAGALFFVSGVITLIVSTEYSAGTALRMGPGYFPTILGGILAALGLIIAARSLWISGGIERQWKWRPLIVVLGAIVLFGLFLESLGLVGTAFALILVSRFGGYRYDPREVLALGAFMTLLVAVLFVYGLGLPIRLWPEF
jgi:hypothetical protein